VPANHDLCAMFTAEAIRDHYYGAEEDPTVDMTDAELESVGNTALNDDYFWDVYGQVVGDAMTRFTSEKINQEREGNAT
jgi:hypothetical protein